MHKIIQKNNKKWDGCKFEFCCWILGRRVQKTAGLVQRFWSRPTIVETFYVLLRFLTISCLTSQSQPAQRLPGKKSVWLVGSKAELEKDISPVLPNFYRSKKSEIWPRFSIPVAFDMLWFERNISKI